MHEDRTIWLIITAIIFLGIHYKIEHGYIAVFVFVGAVCYAGETLLGLGMIYSWFGFLGKDGKKFIAIYLPFLILEFIRCCFDLRKGYVQNNTESIFVYWVYVIAFGYTLISLFYFLATSKVMKKPMTTFLGTKKLIEEKSHSNESEV